MYPKRRVLVALFAAFALSAAAAQGELSIGFFDKRVYVPGAEVLVKVTIRNGSPAAWRFKLADDKRLSIGFDVRSISNRPVEPSDAWKRAVSSSNPLFYRELSIQPGEEYSFVEDLRNYVDLAEPGSFIVSCMLYPELSVKPDTGMTIRSNLLSLSLRPGAPTPAATESFRAGTAEILKAEHIGPDEVVSRTISARQHGQWNEFFLYLDIQRLLEANVDKKRSYDRESDDGRRRMIAAYKADLMTSVVDSDIVVIPSSYAILETRYGPSYGTVKVLQKFDYDGFKMLKEYTYELERRDDIWFIVAYSVMNKGTE
ncbi:MAG: hypothetical protein CVV51_04320 [Spirochaetae bacterium HGW-Spirochaetae-7]|nr:MAG: hypothetical protein CVV51_04320 [Spirochaetae bacterium HGW-Spirochaetae-7]